MTELIRVGNFCEIVTDKFTKEKIKRGHIVYVAGHKSLPISDEDPYTQRVKFFVHTYDAHDKLMGTELYLIDPNSILPLKASDQEYYLKEYKRANGLD